MKNIFRTILGTAALLAAFSCSNLNDFPVFDPAESFAAFEKSNYMINEDYGQLIIPVTIASIDPVNTTVSYRINDGTAKAGVNVKDTNSSAVLTFADGARTQNIVLDIISLEGEYTGDLDFSVELLSATGLKLSSENVCNVIIADLDHPLAAILGTYVATSQNYAGADITWELTLTKDEKDVTVVHCDFFTPGCIQYSNWGDWSYVGTVSEDKKSISFAVGQKCQAWYQTEDDQFQLLTWEPGIYLYDTGNVVFNEVSEGVWYSAEKVWLYPVVTGSLYTNWCVRETTWTKK